MTETPRRTVRIDDALWQSVAVRARHDHVATTTVIVSALRAWLGPESGPGPDEFWSGIPITVIPGAREATAATAKRTALYLLHDADDGLLYAGASGRPRRRFSEHVQDKSWWPEVARATVEWFGSREDAQAAERAVIATLEPRYNGVAGIGCASGPSPVVQFRVPVDILAAIDEVRGDRTRSAWILRAIEDRLAVESA